MQEGQLEFVLSLKTQFQHKNNMKKTILIMSCLVTYALQAQELTLQEKIEFADFYRKRVDLLKIYPNKPEVKVIFVDFDNDRQQEALATSYESFGETGWLWSAYRKKGAKWEEIDQYETETKTVQEGACIYARPGEIFSLVDEDNRIQFVVLNRNYDKLAPNGIGPINKSVFHLDEKGIFQQNKVDNLEQLLAYRGTRSAGIVKSLESLKVELFPEDGHAKIEEQNKAQHPTDGAPLPEKPKE